MTHRIALAAFCLLAAPAFAQLKLPSLSPAAKVSATAGLTDVTVEYSSPAVKGRKIWGGVVAMDQVWRAGANKATQVTFSQPVKVGDADVAAGTYSLFAIPGAASWTLILNKNAEQWGSNDYKKELDAARVTVKPVAISNRERLTYILNNASNDSISIDLEWEKVRVSLPVKLKTAEMAEKNISEASDDAWEPMTNAARYYLEAKDFTKCIAASDKSIAIKETWLNTWVKAQCLAGSGKKADAYAMAEKAQTLGAKEGGNFYMAADVKKALTEWKGK